MTALYVPLAGDVPSAAELATFAPIGVIKPSDEPYGPNNTTMHNDSALFASVAANASYLVAAHFVVSGPGSTTSGNLAVRFAFPAGATFVWSGAGEDQSTFSGGTGKGQGIGEWLAFVNSTSPSTSLTFGAGANTLGIIVRASIVVGSTAGTLAVQWAQDANNGAVTTMRQGSSLELRQVA